MMDPIERDIARALGRCTYQPASWDKRFARDIAYASDNPEVEATDRQRWWLHRLAVRYRRQMPARLVEAATAWLAENLDEPPKVRKRKNGHRTRSSERAPAQRALLLSIALVAVLFVTAPAFAQSVCGDRRQIVDALENHHQEFVDSTGTIDNGGLAELFVADGGSWTLMMTLPGGPTCLLASGENWGPAVPKERKPETRTH